MHVSSEPSSWNRLRGWSLYTQGPPPPELIYTLGAYWLVDIRSWRDDGEEHKVSAQSSYDAAYKTYRCVFLMCAAIVWAGQAIATIWAITQSRTAGFIFFGGWVESRSCREDVWINTYYNAQSSHDATYMCVCRGKTPIKSTIFGSREVGKRVDTVRNIIYRL